MEEKKDEEKKIEWKRLLDFNIKRDWKVIVFVIFLVYISWAYKYETSKCDEIYYDTKKFCQPICEEQTGIFDSTDNSYKVVPFREGTINISTVE